VDGIGTVGCFGHIPCVCAATLLVTAQTPDGRPLPGAVVTARPLDVQAHPRLPCAPLWIKSTGPSSPICWSSRWLDNRISEHRFCQPPDLLVLAGQAVSTTPVSRQSNPPVRFEQAEWSRSAATSTTECRVRGGDRCPFFGRTDSAGSWSADLPRGRYRVSIWHPRLRSEGTELEREVTIGEADRATLTLRLARPLQPAPIEKRPHSWDSY